MKNPKKHHPIVALASIALGVIIPVSLAGEKDKPAGATTVISAKEDPVHVHLRRTIIDPLNQQANRFSKFSRRMPTSSTKYHLVESDSSDSGVRSFQVMRVDTPLRKGLEATKTEFLKVRYLENTSGILVSLKEKWVKVEDHPILKALPQTRQKAAPKITP